jgi:hypothetical protein
MCSRLDPLVGIRAVLTCSFNSYINYLVLRWEVRFQRWYIAKFLRVGQAINLSSSVNLAITNKLHYS